MEELLRAIVLGIVQGLTEFIPVSSSGHLILIPALFRWPDQGLAFDAGLHGGTLVAVLAYFWRDWRTMFSAFGRDAVTERFSVGRYSPYGRLLVLLAAASAPVAVVGLLFNEWVEEHTREPWMVATMLAAFGVVLLLADRRAETTRDSTAVGLGRAMAIGVAQTLAVFPGVSRSGVTISAGRALGLDRGESARFAFLLGTPAIGGAALLSAADFAGSSGEDVAVLISGLVMSAVVGWLAVAFLMRFLRTRSYLPFVVYRIGVAGLALAIAGARVA